MLSRYEESIRALQEAAKRDPLNFIPVNNYAETLYLMGRTSEADVVVERVSAVNPLVAQDTAIHGELLAGNRAKGVRLALEVADPRQPGDPFDFSSRLQLATLFASLGLRDEVFGAEIFAEAFKKNGWWQGHMLFYECREALALMENEERSTTQVLDEVLAVSCAADYRVVDEWLKDLWDPRTHWFGEQLWGGQFPGFDATLLLVADTFRRTGHEADAKVWRDIADRMISGKARAGYRNYFEQAMLYAYDGRDDEAVQKLVAAIRYGNHWRAAAAIPLVSPLTKRPEYQEAMKKERAVLDRQRAEVLEMLCGPEPVSKTYKPAPATCAR
jgi:hypothetical protein